MVGNGRREHPLQRRNQSALLGMQCRSVVDGTTAGYRTLRFLTFKQASELGGNVRKGEHGTKVYFVKQLQVHEKGSDDNSATSLVPMMREYTVFNVDQCENLPDEHQDRETDRVFAIPTRATSLPTHSCVLLALTSARATVKPFMCPSHDFISMPGVRCVQGRGSFLQRGLP